MSGDEGYKFQVSLKYGPDNIGMLNVRADSNEEFAANLAAALETLGANAVLVDAYNTEFPKGAPATSPAPAGRPQGGQASPTSTGEVCQHGSMVFRSGNKDGKAWSAWFCPTDKNAPDKCQPKFTR